MQHTLRPYLIAVIVFVFDIFCMSLSQNLNTTHLETTVIAIKTKKLIAKKALKEKLICNLDTRVNIFIKKQEINCK